jgi:hypothetical protein
MDPEKAVAAAAENFATTIAAAKAAGYRVEFPVHLLASVPVSETGRVKPVEPAASAEPPVPVLGRRNAPLPGA